MSARFEDSVVEQSFIAVVAGSTGATGRWIVSELINSSECTKVIALTRGEIENPGEVFSNANAENLQAKLTVQKVDWKQLQSSETLPNTVTESPTIAFCAMGSAPYSEESDYILPVAFAKACRGSQIHSMFLVSASTAKAGSWLGYNDTLGRREETFKDLGFNRLGIYRPGMMDRQEKRRTKELIGAILPGFLKIDTKDIAKTMMASALRMKPGVHYFSHSEMKEFAKTGQTL